MKNSITVESITPLIGAEISGLDLRQELTEDDLATVNEALLQHQVLFFRDQEMTIEQHLALGRRFGDLHLHPARFRNGLDAHPEILLVHADETTTRATGDDWHSEVSCDAEPPKVSILRLFEVPSNGGDTLFASMYAAIGRAFAQHEDISRRVDRDP